MKVLSLVSFALGLFSAVAGSAIRIKRNRRHADVDRLLADLASKPHSPESTFHSTAASQFDYSAVPTGNSTGCGSDCASTLSFAGKEAAGHAVGHEIPGFPFLVKNSWSGNLPIGASNPDSTLFFWLWGAEDKEDTDDL